MVIDCVNTIVGGLSLIIGAFSLYFSWIGFKAAKKAAIEAETAKNDAAVLKKLIEKINVTKEIRMEFKESLLDIRQENNRMEKASKLLALLIRIHERDDSWRQDDMNSYLRDLRDAMNRLDNEVKWDTGNNNKAMFCAEGLIAAYIDELGMQAAQYADVNNS